MKKNSLQNVLAAIKDTGSRGKVKSLLPYIIGGGSATAATLDSSDSEASNIGQRGFKSLFGSPLTDATQGAFRGADNMLRYEIPDNGMRIDKNFLREFLDSDSAVGATSYLGDAIEHDDLFKAYPALANMDLTVNRLPAGGKAEGEFYPSADIMRAKAPNLRELLDTIAHEQQHGIQSLEGFSQGTNPRRAGSFDQYYNTPAEVEARSVASRRRMTAEQREQQPADRMDVLRALVAAGIVPEDLPLVDPVWSPTDLAAAAVGVPGMIPKIVAMALDAPASVGLDYGMDNIANAAKWLGGRQKNMEAWF